MGGGSGVVAVAVITLVRGVIAYVPTPVKGVSVVVATFLVQLRPRSLVIIPYAGGEVHMVIASRKPRPLPHPRAASFRV